MGEGVNSSHNMFMWSNEQQLNCVHVDTEVLHSKNNFNLLISTIGFPKKCLKALVLFSGRIQIRELRF